MKRLKETLKKLLLLPPVPTVVIALPSFAFVFAILVTGRKTAVAYVAYVVSAYALVITVTGFAGVCKAVRDGLNKLPLLSKIRRTPLGARLLGDDVFRSNIALHGGLLSNLLYAALHLVSGVRYRSAWFAALAVYYLLLSAMRAALVQYVHQTPLGQDIPAELRRYRVCGAFLLLMNQALAGIVMYIVSQNKGFTYSGRLIYAMAVYTFYSTGMAIAHLVKYRKRGSPVLSAAKATKLTAALVSMLSLETAMLARFGSHQPDFRRMMTAVSGGAVCVLVGGIAVYMIVHSTRQLSNPMVRRQSQ